MMNLERIIQINTPVSKQRFKSEYNRRLGKYSGQQSNSSKSPDPKEFSELQVNQLA